MEEEYPALKDSVQTKWLKFMAEIKIDNNFNRPDQAIAQLSELLKNHRQELGISGTSGMIQLATILNGEKGNYAATVEGIKNFIDVPKASDMTQDLQPSESLYHYYNTIRHYLPPAIIRTGQSTEVRIHIQQARDGQLIYIPATIHAKTYKFIFDTRAIKSLVSKQFAKEMELQIVGDPIAINAGNQGEGTVRKSYLDSM